MEINYKIYVYDRGVDCDYPITIKRKGFVDLCKWLNAYIQKWDLEILSVQLLDSKNYFVSEVHFIPTEITNQYFIETLPKRLIAYNEFIDGGI